MRKSIVVGIIIILFVLFVCVLSNVKYYEVESSNNIYEDSVIGLSINGSATTNFPSKESGLAIDSIICDKGASGVWDYSNWMLKVKNVSQNRTKCQVNFVSKYTENILNGTDPVLKEGLIPVEISDNGIVTRAKLADDWYSYENQKWANAVILTNESKEYYEGEEISEGDIESYFVWIPRYKYQLWNMGNYEGLNAIDTNQVHRINVVFGLDTTIDTDYECITPMRSGESGNCSVGKYMTHPAFLAFDTSDDIIKGMWVGKFETGYKGATSTSEAERNLVEPNSIIIKPNVYSWRAIQVANAYLSSYDYKREFDSHMMKNTEWGAVAYLQHSQYGSHERVRINNNSAFLTGYGAVHEPTTGFTQTSVFCSENSEACNEHGTNDSITQPWNTTIGVLASTTGNISGIYDMSGGAWEYVMGVMLDSTNTIPCSGKNVSSNSGFSGAYCAVGENNSLINSIKFPKENYYNIYVYNMTDQYFNRRILGDATGEMGPFSFPIYTSFAEKIGSWYTAESRFIYSNFPWFCRGGEYESGLEGGVFSYERDHGFIHSYRSFRIILSPI